MEAKLARIFQNGAFGPLDTEDLPIRESAIVTITVVDELPRADHRWMKQLLHYEDDQQFLNSVDRDPDR